MSIFSYYVVITEIENQFFVTIPDLNCSATSINFIEAIDTAEDLVRDYLFVKLNKSYIPPASNLKDLIVPDGASLIYVSVNTGFR